MLVLVMVMMFVFILIMIVMLVFLVFVLIVSLCPACRTCSFFKVIKICIENVANAYLTVVSLNNFSLWLKSSDHSLNSAELLLIYHINFVENDSRTELNLLNNKAFNVFFVNIVFKKIVAAAKLCSHSECVNNSYNVVKTADSRSAFLFVTLKYSNRLCNREWLADTACLNENIIKFT